MLIPFFAFGQVNTDSLWHVWKDPAQPDTSRLKAIQAYAWYGYLFTYPDSAYHFAQMEYDFALSKELTYYMAKATNVKGVVKYLQGNYEEAIAHYKECAALYESIDDKIGVAKSVGNIGQVYIRLLDLSSAIQYYSKSLKVFEELEDPEGVAVSLINMGNIYFELKEYDIALDKFLESAAIYTEIGDKIGVAHNYMNIGNVYQDQQKFDEALNYYQQSYEIQQEVGNEKGAYQILVNIATILKAQQKYELALAYFEECLAYFETINTGQELAATLNNISAIKFEKGQLNEAKKTALRGLHIAEDVGSMPEIKYASKSLWQIYKALGNTAESLAMCELYYSIKDSIDREDNQNEVIKQQYKYTYDKQAAADSVEAAQFAKIKEAELEVEKANNKRAQLEAKQQQQQKYYLFGGLALALFFGGFIFNRFRVTSRQKNIIANQKQEVESQKLELEETHYQLAEHHKEISDSIIYAKRIQEAIMPSMKSMNEALGNGFVLYLPKDVVAGDFFWMETVTDNSGTDEGKVVYFAAADCTGHGVPGAMVSVVCSHALTKSLLEEGIRETGKLLDRTREIVIERLAKSGEEVKDGMDISLCALNKQTHKLQWSGANNPIWILRKDSDQIEEIKANKQPIGVFHAPEPFTSHEIQLSAGDTIYIFTDGYQDQFGGPRGKKFKAQQLKSFILTNRHKPMDEQLALLRQSFMDWRGNLEQIDDVCIIGVSV